ncbi:DNA endonuclease SmrA [Kineobactrum salinum]|uniref:DNA endonuclease SmrA n=1 Tax=Kineobactrum salinum TaxID=2708301 RepID=A0A6C0U3Y9_9GAMM|nr:DNA endonuclease SmrA [Kineobactrum salinum]QIB66573.1 DNA endonuclease SmrA [Kineobactrum salinum]
MADDEQDEWELFQQEMAGVERLRQERRVALGLRSGDSRDSSLQQRREAAVNPAAVDRNILSELEPPVLDPWYILDFKRPGVQNGVYRKLRQGRYEQEAQLDLHRLTRQLARRELFDFIEQCHELGLRSVVIVHGKGERRPERERSGVLKACVDYWLRELPVVQAFHSAQPRHGGTGAVYVLLRKSERQKQKNRERFLKGRLPPDSR